MLSACLLTRRAMNRRRRWTSASIASTMDRYGPRNSTPRRPARLPKLALPVLRAASRRALRADRCSAHRRHGSFAGPPEPGDRPPARLGQPLRRPEPRAHRRRAPARAARPARLHGRCEPCPGLRRGRERLEPLRRRGQPRARVLLPPVEALGRATIVAGWAYTSWWHSSASSATRGWRPWTPGE